MNANRANWGIIKKTTNAKLMTKKPSRMPPVIVEVNMEFTMLTSLVIRDIKSPVRSF